MKNIAISLLISSAVGVSVERAGVYTTMRHWNEDPHSSASPMVGGQEYLTSTQARFEKEKSTLNKKAVEPEGNLPGWFASTGAFQGPYNARDKEYVQVQSDDSDSSDSDEEEDHMNVQTEAELEWHVAPDYGELDGHGIYREADGAFYDFEGNGKGKLGGWTNPLSWTDDGTDDN